MKKILIDVSEHQGKIDWEKVMPHIDGAILRCGYGGDYEDQDDEQFRRNADECTRLGIPFGVYLYSYAKSIQAAQYEADHVLRLINGYEMSYPVYLDLEESGTADGAVERAIVFGDIIEKAGYWCGIYANLYWWEMILKDGLERFTKWVAQYNSKCEYTGANLDIWQYTSKGNVPGISGNVDMNECYRDFPAEILGGAKVEEVKPAPVKKTVAELAQEVLAGKHGNGKARIESLGEDFDAVQDEVNRILGVEQPEYHTILDRETLSGIAERFNTTVSALVKLNGIKNPDLIYVNQKIRVK